MSHNYVVKVGKNLVNTAIYVLGISLCTMGCLDIALAQVTQTPFSADPTLKIEQVTPKGLLPNPTSFVFIGPDEMLVARQSGQIHRVVGGSVETTPVLSFSYPSVGLGELGLLSIALDPQFHEPGHNFVYVLAATPTLRLRRYTWAASSLSSETLLLQLPAVAPQHVGGSMVFGPPDAAPEDQKLFIVRGDGLNNSKSENFEGSREPEGTGMVLRINKDGSTPTGPDKGPFYDVANGNVHLERMYAYGIRNSFGLAFDPVSSALWDTENGPEAWDEINRIDPGFNSGWADTMGPSTRTFPQVGFPNPGIMSTFGNPPVGTYSDPKFSFLRITVPTAIIFLNTDHLGAHNRGACIVAANEGLYRFHLNEDRSEFTLQGDLADKVLETTSFPPTNPGEETPIRFCYYLGAPVDLEIGPDGYLYVLSYFDQNIYRIKTIDAHVPEWHLYDED